MVDMGMGVYDCARSRFLLFKDVENRLGISTRIDYKTVPLWPVDQHIAIRAKFADHRSPDYDLFSNSKSLFFQLTPPVNPPSEPFF